MPSDVTNPNCRETYASLCLFGSVLDPTLISTILRLSPSDAAHTGDVTHLSSGKTHVAPRGRWIFATSGLTPSTDAEHHISLILDRLDAVSAQPTHLPGVEAASISVYWVSATGNGGPAVSPAVMRRLTHYELPLEFDIYFDDSAPPTPAVPG